LSEAIQTRGLHILINDLTAIAKKLGAESMSGVATDVIRKASNGGKYVSQVESRGVIVRMVPQEVEAELGFSG
jgi:exopolyphosphatase/pppGpp-phosphohydrolase